MEMRFAHSTGRPARPQAGLVTPALLLSLSAALFGCQERERAAAETGPPPREGQVAEAPPAGDREAPAGTAATMESPAHVLDLRPDRPRTTGLDSTLLAAALARADSLPRLRCLLVARQGETAAEWCRRGFGPDAYANVKSVSKSVLSALVGIAIAEGHLEGVDQPIMPLLDTDPDTIAPDKAVITIGNLLSMQSGLERTSGRNYGAWVSSSDWVRDALRRRMVAEPGGRMLYSTGNYHLLSAILTRVTGESTHAFARSRLGEPLGIAIPRWLADPQGIYFGGNEMRLTPRGMLRFGELYRNQGRHDGRAIVPADWVRRSLMPRTRSPWSGEEYGYGWFLGSAGRHRMFYGWGYGGQFVFVVPDLELTMVTTSDPAVPRGGSHLREIHDILDRWIVPAAERGAS
jgi:CubicO group peptidase (beta-lactamase class C family)